MKFCENCGKELADDAAVCMNCGVPITTENFKTDKPAKKKTKVIVLSIVGAVLAVAIILGIMFIPKIIKANKIEKALIGKTFSYDEFFYYLGNYELYEYEFKEGNKVHYTYYYSNIDSGGDYDKDYKIKVLSNDRALVIIGREEFLLDFNYDGTVKSMTDTKDSDKVFK